MIKPGTVRFILAMIVVLFHITKLVYIGTFAVFVFFMLSGYWIALMYGAKYSKLQSPVVTFYISRLWRVLPVYLLITLLSIVVHYYYYPGLLARFTQYDTMGKITYLLSNITLIGYNSLDSKLLVPAWSLDIEMQFYIFFPLIFALIFRNSLVKYILFFAAAVTHLLLAIYYPESTASKTLLYYLPYFLIGMIIYFNNLKFSFKTEVVFNSIFIVIILINYLVAPLRAQTMANNASLYNMYLNEFLPLLLIPFISNSVKRRSESFDKSLGDVSFEIYLIHASLLIIYSKYSAKLPFVERVPFTIAFIVATLAIGWVIYHYFDRPIDSFRKAWVNKRKRKSMDAQELPKQVLS